MRGARQCLREYVGVVVGSANILEGDLLGSYHVSKDVKPYVNVLRSLVHRGVVGEVDGGLVVAVEGRRVALILP